MKKDLKDMTTISLVTVGLEPTVKMLENVVKEKEHEIADIVAKYEGELKIFQEEIQDAIRLVQMCRLAQIVAPTQKEITPDTYDRVLSLAKELGVQ